jgi:O-antigen/teichoic acid export membrane protein
MGVQIQPPDVPAPDGVLESRPRPAAVHSRLAMNSISNVSKYVVSVLLTFVLTPLLLRVLGDSTFGFWVVLGSFLGYAAVLEMGIQTAVVKLVGELRASQEAERLSDLLNASMVFFLAISLLAASACAFLMPRVIGSLSPAAGAQAHLHGLLIVLALNIAVMLMDYYFAGVMYGLQLYHRRNMILVLAWLLNGLSLLIILPTGGLFTVLVAKTATDALAMLLTFGVCRRSLPEFHLDLGRLHRHRFRELFAFGSRVFLYATSTRIATNARPIIISKWLSSESTVLYAIPNRLTDYLKEVCFALSAGFMPTFSELKARAALPLLKSIYLNYSRYMFLILLPLCALTAILGPSFIRLWIGPDYAERTRIVLYLLSGCLLAESAQPLIWRFLFGAGLLGLPVKVSSAMSLISIVAGIALVKPLGVAGVAGSLLVTTAVTQVFLLHEVCSFFEMTWLGMLRTIHAGALLACVPATAAILATLRLLGADSYATLLLQALVFSSCYVAVALLVALSTRERRWLQINVLRRRS